MDEMLPAETVAAIRAQVGTLADGIVDAIRADSPVYAGVLAAPEGMAIRLGIEQAIRAFLDAVERGARDGRTWSGGADSDTDELWRRLGEAEFQSGRSLDDLRAAFRLGVRAAWRGAADAAIKANVSAPVAISLAEAIFVYGDALAGDVVEGYLRMQSDVAGEQERRRRRLAAMLVDVATPHDADAVARAAELAEWRLPRTAAILALAGDDPGAVARRLDADVLPGADADGAWLLIPDPDAPGRAAAIERAVASEPAALGPAVPLAAAAESLRWARATLALAREAMLASDQPLIRTTDHLADVILLQDRGLAEQLVTRRLGPLATLPRGERERLTETLRAWLGHQRHTPQVAAALHVHPQTVRYRVAKLRDLLGPALDEPADRFELELALRVEAALSADLA